MRALFGHRLTDFFTTSPLSPSSLLRRDDSIARTSTPLSISPDPDWDGIDGAWSTFTIGVGTPLQYVRALVSFNAYQTLVVLPEGCTNAQGLEACADARGSLFQTNASTTWDRIGIYDILVEKNLGVGGNALYGYDAVGLGGAGQGGPTLQNTTVGGVAVLEYYVGVLGINPKPTNFTGFDDPSPSYISMLYEQNYIPSVSFGYTGGAPYRSSGVLASLTLGGYDSSRFVPNDITFTFAGDNSRDLVVAVQSIATSSQAGSSTDLLPTPIYAFIDSTVSQIWLPMDACLAFESEFGLTYDNTTNLYLVNDTLHQALLDRDASITFKLGQDLSNSPAVEITLPYAAFDLEAQPPYKSLNSSARYFPLNRAANDTQYTLGRTFLQEAYLSVDWQSAKFNVSEVSWDQSGGPTLVAIIPDDSSGNSTSTETSSGDGNNSMPSAGVIVGAIVGGVALIALLGIFLMFHFRRKKRAAGAREAEKSISFTPSRGPASNQYQHTWSRSEAGGYSPHTAEHKRLLSTSESMTKSLPSTPHLIPLPSPAFFQGGPSHSAPNTPPAHYHPHFDSRGSIQPSPWSTSFFAPVPLSEADGRDQQIYEMAGDFPVVGEKDGRALSEKEVLAHRERVYNGVESPSATSPPAAAAAPLPDTVRVARRVNPGEVVRADRHLALPGPAGPRKRFSYEDARSSREVFGFKVGADEEG